MKLVLPERPVESVATVLTCPQCGEAVDIATRSVLILDLRGPSHASQTHIVLCSPECRTEYWSSGATESLFRPVTAKEWDQLTDEKNEAESWSESLREKSRHVDNDMREQLRATAESRVREIEHQRAREILCDASDPRTERDLLLSVIELDARPDQAPQAFRVSDLAKPGADLGPLKEQWSFNHALEFDDFWRTPSDEKHAEARREFEEWKRK